MILLLYFMLIGVKEMKKMNIKFILNKKMNNKNAFSYYSNTSGYSYRKWYENTWSVSLPKKM